MGPALNRLCQCLAEQLAASLHREERDAVLGDLAETGAPPNEVAIELFGLVLRRQAALWTRWRPWAALAGVTIPVGCLLAYLSDRNARTSAIYLWLYLDNWDWALFNLPGFRHDLLVHAADILFSWTGLALWSWTAGRILRSASRSSLPVHATIFSLLLFLAPMPHFAPRVPVEGANHAVFALAFYRVFYPLMVKTILVLLPVYRALRTARPQEKIA